MIAQHSALVIAVPTKLVLHAQLSQPLSALLVAALQQTEIPLQLPDADLVVKLRKGHVLPTVEVVLRMPHTEVELNPATEPAAGQ